LNRPRLSEVPDLLELAFAIGIVVVIAKSIIVRSWFVSGDVSAATLVSSMLAYLLVSRALRSRASSFERVFTSLIVVVSGIWLYETTYHYAYGSTLPYIFVNLFTFGQFSNISTSASEPFNYFPLPWALLMVSLPLVGFRFMTLNKWFAVCIISSAVLFGVWISLGYPQWVYPGLFFGKRLIQISPESTALYGRIFSSVTKLAIKLIPASLFLGRKLMSQQDYPR
jgi:hypothetical protein